MSVRWMQPALLAVVRTGSSSATAVCEQPRIKFHQYTPEIATRVVQVKFKQSYLKIKRQENTRFAYHWRNEDPGGAMTAETTRWWHCTGKRYTERCP